jgi:cytoskeletal protein CcmA (bactofilin family)
MVNIGKSVVIKGELSGSEDLTIEGQVEGKIELRQNILTIGPNAHIKAQIFAKAIVIQGEVHGNVTATDKIDIRDAGSVDGDLSAPRVAIADGAHFRGSIDMQRPGASETSVSLAAKPAEAKPAAATPAAATPVAATSPAPAPPAAATPPGAKAPTPAVSSPR